ncbi:hypothetical protein Prum_010130 [Phytohabitans rumicis]|uniref:PKD domain-containing protein n=1 Tax=Phytohabitans rumicis TaxID=1076125 RepID=A0A6V8KY51_9ACTN|nr:hypothetical protein Prum_010130 [Phytohabitans rumicis]
MWTGTGQYFVRGDAGQWTRIGLPQDGVTRTWIPRDISDDGQVVGEYYEENGDRHAVSWRDGRLTRLEDLVVTESGFYLDTANLVNADGVIAGVGGRHGADTLFVALPVDPVVFVHGMGASRMASFDDGGNELKELWLDCSEGRIQLSLHQKDIDEGKAPKKVEPTDVLRRETCYQIGDWFNPALNTYGTLLERLNGTDTYAEYKVDGDLDRQTTAGCDTDQLTNRPNLFVFTYDWRLSNVKAAEKLADYLGCIRKFWPDREVDVLTHSMGSLVARRYVLDHLDNHGVDRMVTIGAPWMGAPKLVNVLYTGNFAPWAVNGPVDVIKHIAERFTSAHEMAPGPVYGAAAITPVIREAGWDLNGVGGAHQRYTDEDVRTLLNDDFEDTTPGATALAFQSHRSGQQVDWRNDTSGIKYTHIVGLKAGADTIGTTVANQGVVCSGIFIVQCTTEQWFSEEFTCGDGTVPIVSAVRAGRGVDYNDPKAEVLPFISNSATANFHSEHTGMAQNPAVLDALLSRLYSLAPQDEVADHSDLLDPGIENFSCFRGQTPQPARARAASDGEVAEPAPGTALRYVSVLGATDLTVTDSRGTTDPLGGTAGYVNGVTVLPSPRPDAAMATIPVSSTENYRIRFTGTGAPLRLTLLEGMQQRPSQATRWLDMPLAAGTVAELTTAADGVDVLRVDTDGEGTPDEAVPPTARLAGTDAADVTAPEPTVTALRQGGTTRYVVSATDTGTGVARILWSTDGTQFQPYQGELELDPAMTPNLTVFAEDRAGNRSAPRQLALADLAPGLFTTATLDPAPTGAGWSPGKVTVTLAAQASEGGVASVTYRTSGAQDGPERTVDGDTATLAVTAPGATTVTYWATAADGTREPARTVRVRVDPGAPTATVRVPVDGAVVGALDRIAGTAADDASGVANVVLELRDGRGRYWNGSAWVTEAATLPVQGRTTWVRDTGLPAGDNLPVGGYRVRALVTDGAGHTVASGSSAFTVGQAAIREIRELPHDDVTAATGAVAINDRGVVVGGAADGRGIAVRWYGGRATRLGLPEGMTDYSIDAVDAAGTAYGDAWSGSGVDLRQVPVRWDAAGTPAVLPLPETADRGGAMGVSDNGQTVVGEVRVVDGSSSRGLPARWTQSGVQTLPLLPGAESGWAVSSADDGSVVGVLKGEGGYSTAVVWSDGQAHGVPTEPLHSTEAADINNLGVAVGTDTIGSKVSGFVYAEGARTQITTAFQTAALRPSAINDRSEIVGEFDSPTGPRAFLAEPGGLAVDLNTLLPPDSGWQLVRARDINELGQIVGYGKYRGADRGFIMTARHAPVARDVSAATAAGAAVEIALDPFDPDVVDQPTATVVDAPAHGTVSAVTDGKVTYTPAGGFHGTDRFTYVASDGGLTSAPGVVTVEVTRPAGNEPPEVALEAPETAVEGGTVELKATATDPEGDNLTWTWSATGGEITGSATTATLVAGDGPADVTVRVEVGDGTHTVVRTATIAVSNAAPVVTAGEAVTVPWGVATTLTGTVDDPGPQDRAAGLSPRWAFGDGTTADGTQVRHAWTDPGRYTATLTAADRNGATGSADVSVAVVAHRTDVRLAAIAGVFGAATVTATVTDPDAQGTSLTGRPVVFTVDGTALPTVTTGADGTATVPVATLGPGAHTVSATVAATDRYLAGAAAPVGVTVTQSTGTVTGSVRTAGGCATFTAKRQGQTTSGTLTWEDSNGRITIPVRSLGIVKTPAGKPAAWFAGSAGGRTFLAYVEDNGRRGAGDVFRLWIDGNLRTATGSVTSGDVSVNMVGT